MLVLFCLVRGLLVLPCFVLFVRSLVFVARLIGRLAPALGLKLVEITGIARKVGAPRGAPGVSGGIPLGCDVGPPSDNGITLSCDIYIYTRIYIYIYTLYILYIYICIFIYIYTFPMIIPCITDLLTNPTLGHRQLLLGGDRASTLAASPIVIKAS